MGRIRIGVEKLVVHRRTEAGLAGFPVKALQMAAESSDVSRPEAADVVAFSSVIGHGSPHVARFWLLNVKFMLHCSECK
jgi:hypothetical protein